MPIAHPSKTFPIIALLTILMAATACGASVPPSPTTLPQASSPSQEVATPFLTSTSAPTVPPLPTLLYPEVEIQKAVDAYIEAMESFPLGEQEDVIASMTAVVSDACQTSNSSIPEVNLIPLSDRLEIWTKHQKWMGEWTKRLPERAADSPTRHASDFWPEVLEQLIYTGVRCGIPIDVGSGESTSTVPLNPTTTLPFTESEIWAVRHLHACYRNTGGRIAEILEESQSKAGGIEAHELETLEWAARSVERGNHPSIEAALRDSAKTQDF